MGEAKRRKKLDPNYGKSSQTKLTKNPNEYLDNDQKPVSV